ncbi:MAG: N-acetyltransferase [Pseudomonadota bacterium]
MSIREASKKDWNAIWPIFHEIVAAGETYAYERDTSKQQGQNIWLDIPRKTYVFCDNNNNNEILGTYYLKTNHAGPGSHVCNCGYMVSSKARGRGLATSMCEHSQTMAVELGYQAMQFNFVASSNAGAIRLWQKLGFDIVAKLPKAFNHPAEGYIDALVMYKWF